jgi:hypothetical protein
VLINLPAEPVSANIYDSQTNLQIFRAVIEIQKFMTTLPAQVLREQPVYFTDAYGLEVPFHLEFVYSSEVCPKALKYADELCTDSCMERSFKIGCSDDSAKTKKRSSVGSLLCKI